MAQVAANQKKLAAGEYQAPYAAGLDALLADPRLSALAKEFGIAYS